MRIVCDRASGANPLDCPVWLRSSAHHRGEAERLWNEGTLHPETLTVFDAADDLSPEDVCCLILDDVCLHHPEWTSIEVTGAALSQSLKNEMVEIGATSFTSLANGFIASRSDPNDAT